MVDGFFCYVLKSGLLIAFIVFAVITREGTARFHVLSLTKLLGQGLSCQGYEDIKKAVGERCLTSLVLNYLKE